MHTYEALVFHYKDLKWWSTIELVKRIPIVILIMSFPLNPVSQFIVAVIHYNYYSLISMVMLRNYIFHSVINKEIGYSSCYQPLFVVYSTLYSVGIGFGLRYMYKVCAV